MQKNRLEAASAVMTGLAVRILLVTVFLFLLTQGMNVAYRFGHGLFYEHGMTTEAEAREVELTIREGEGRKAIGEELKKEGLINNLNAFLLQTRLYNGRYVPGTYTLSTSMTMKEIIQSLTEEGKKQRNLPAENRQTEAASEETDAGGNEIIGGGNEGGEQDSGAAEEAKPSSEGA